MSVIGANDLKAVCATTWRTMRAECQYVSFDNWDESVLRWIFIKSLGIHFPQINCEREWQRIDLLIRDGDSPILVEFKYYFGPNRRHDLAGNITGWRGRFGEGNFGEFQKCVNDQRRKTVGKDKLDISGCRRFIVLAYASRPGNPEKMLNGAQWYDDVSVAGLERLMTLKGLRDTDLAAERKLALFAVHPLTT